LFGHAEGKVANLIPLLDHYQTPKFFKENFNYFDNWQEVAGYPNVTICKSWPHLIGFIHEEQS
jgi:hypothetical protein